MVQNILYRSGGSAWSRGHPDAKLTLRHSYTGPSSWDSKLCCCKGGQDRMCNRRLRPPVCQTKTRAPSGLQARRWSRGRREYSLHRHHHARGVSSQHCRLATRDRGGIWQSSQKVYPTQACLCVSQRFIIYFSAMLRCCDCVLTIFLHGRHQEMGTARQRCLTRCLTWR